MSRMMGWGMGRWGAGILGALFLLGGLLLLGEQLAWWDVDLRALAPLFLLALGALFLLGAATGRGWREAPRAEAQEREAWEGWGWGGPWAHHEPAMGAYWMVVMAGFFLLMGALWLGRNAGLTGLSWGLAGPYFLLAVGGMFVLRALLRAREARAPREGAPGAR